MAGSGQFPFLVARGAKRKGFRVAICGFQDNADPALADEADAYISLPLGRLNDLISFFKKQGADTVCMAGAISKPKAVMDIKPDLRVTMLAAKLKLAGKALGDDAILRGVTGELQSEGITVVRPDTLADELLSPAGILSAKKPDAELWHDIRYGWKIAKAVGTLDIGQCVVVRNNIVVAVEGMEGTDATLERGGALGGAGCTAIKVVKPGQDKRLDLPSLGAGTLELLARHKYACLAFEAAGTLFFDSGKALGIADDNGIAVVAVPAEADAFFDSFVKR
jgi:DUF1009 family protein